MPTPKQPSSKALLALGGSGKAEWFPTVMATADGANKLTEAIVTMAYYMLEGERKEHDSEIPPLRIGKKINLAYEAVLRERALYYLQSLKLEADASTVEILSDIFARQLYLHHPGQWESLSAFLRNMATGKSASYQSVIGRLVDVVVPFLQVEGIATVREVMEIVVQGGLSNIYHLLPNLLTAVNNQDAELVKQMLSDAKSLRRSEIFDKYKRSRVSIPPAKAVLTHCHLSGWQLTLRMTGPQKRLILNRLGSRIEWE